jgi:hypothetical protein
LACDRPAEHEMAHTGRCAGAKTDVRKCRCSCGGLLHGGTDGASTFAGASPSWSTGSSAGPDEGSVPIIPGPSEARSPIDEALSEIADWLAKNPSVKEQAEAIADIVGEQAVKVLTEYGYALTRRELTSSHFICTILAAIARAIGEFQKQLDKVPDRVISLITGMVSGSVLSDIAVRVIVRSSWRAISELPIFGQVSVLLRVARIAAILTCPALDQHTEVVRFCLYPLAKGIISAAMLRKLREFFPQGWIS